MGTVTQIWRYPVKSMIGELVDDATLDAVGLVGDRTWAVRDLEKGGIRGAKKIGGLMQLAARTGSGGHAEITLPDGTSTSTDADDADAVVSRAVDHRVRLEPLHPADDLEHYRRGAPDREDLMEELRNVFGREDGEPLPDLAVFPPEIMEFESPPGTYYDAFPLMVMTEQALASLAAALPDSVIDVRRFRPSFVIDAPAGSGGHPEFEWAGRRASIGTAEIEFTAACPRCVMVTLGIDDGVPVDRAVLRHVVRDLDQNVGVYAAVVTPGLFRVGDELCFH